MSEEECQILAKVMCLPRNRTPYGLYPLGGRAKAKNKHIGVRKFKILGVENRDKYAGNIVDASDKYYCR